MINKFANTNINEKAEMISPGSVLFALEGKEYRLEAFKENEKNTKLFIVFKDLNNGEKTFATFPVPPHKANWLNVRIEAGEKTYPGITAAKK